MALKKHNQSLVQYILKNDIDICSIQEVLCKKMTQFLTKLKKKLKAFFILIQIFINIELQF